MFPSLEEAMEPVQHEDEDVDAIDNDDLDDESEVTQPFKSYIDPFPYI